MSMEVKEYKLDPVPREINYSSDQDEVYLSVKIGNGQIGGNKVTKNNEIIAKGNLSTPVYLGKISDFQASNIEVETNVLDVNSFTNKCVITTTFTDQNNKQVYSKIDNGDAPLNGVASFNGKYAFKIITVILFILFANFQLYSQGLTEISFEGLETPNSPGFILFDQSPSSIEKPSTPQGIALSLLNIESNGGGIEFAPFWLTNHPGITAEDIVKEKFPIIYNLSMSFSRVEIDQKNYNAIGLRTRLFQNYGKEQIESLKKIRNTLENDILPYVISDPDKLNEAEELRKQYVDLSENPVFHIDIAAAFGGGTPDNSLKKLEINRWATWVSMNWRPKGNDFYYTLLTRYLCNQDFEEQDNRLFDVGTRFNYDIDKLSLSVEYIQRFNLTEDTGENYRLAIVGNYEIANNIFVTSSFGNNFDDKDNLMVIAGINFGFSKNKMKAF